MTDACPTRQRPPVRVADDGWRIPDALWGRIEPLLPLRKPHPVGCHNPRVPDRRAMDAIFFVLRTACQWGALDVMGICSHSAAHRRFQAWVEAGVFLALWKAGLLEDDLLQGLDGSWLSMDGCQTKAPLGGKKTGNNPPDRGKLGATRRLLTDAAGVPVGRAIEGANRHDMQLVKPTIASIPVERPTPTAAAPQGMCMEKGYDDDEVRDTLQECGFTAHSRARGEEAQAIKQEAGFRARRWVVERTHSGMNRLRRVLIRWEKKSENYLALLHFACAWIAFKACNLLG